MKPIGILYDNWSGNTGDAAIGLSLKLMMEELELPYEEISLSSPIDVDKYTIIIVGGGLLLGYHPHEMYDHYKIKGKHILNAVGIYEEDSTNLQYLEQYSYITVRSHGDRETLNYLRVPIHVVPCTTLLLSDLPNFEIIPDPNSVCIHLLPGMFSHVQSEFIDWVCSLPYTIYFLPITHYCDDLGYMEHIQQNTGFTLFPTDECSRNIYIDRSFQVFHQLFAPRGDLRVQT
jgi:hypothetical protein